MNIETSEISLLPHTPLNLLLCSVCVCIVCKITRFPL